MFTFGREHERRTAVASVRNPAQAALILHVVDAFHDLLERKAPAAALVEAIRIAFTGGNSGVWQQASTWLRRSSALYPELNELWVELADHPAANVRFRITRSLHDMPGELVSQVAPRLLADRSIKVSSMARARLGVPPAEAGSASYPALDAFKSLP